MSQCPATVGLVDLERNGVALDKFQPAFFHRFPHFIRVLPRDGQSLRDKIDNPLTRSVPRLKQLKIAHGIVPSVSVPVMDGFSRKKFTSNVLFHHVAVFKDFTRRFSVLSGDVNAPVTVFVFTPPRLKVGGFGLVSHAPKFGAALRAAQAIMATKISAWFANISEWVAALYAGEFCQGASIRIAFPTEIGAWHGAVERIAVVLPSDRRRDTLFHLKRFTALLARKSEHRNDRGGSSVNGLVSVHAGSFAKFTPAISWLHPKGLVAVLARQLYRHGNSPFLNKMEVAMGGSISQGENECHYPA